MKATALIPFRPDCNASSEVVNVKAMLDSDVSDLLPYVKGEIAAVKYFTHGTYIRFVFKTHPVTVFRDYIAIGGFPDGDSACECAREVIALLQGIESRRDRITPDATPHNPPTVIDVYKLLPRKTGCGRCGHPTCLAFATALTREEAGIDACPRMDPEPLASLRNVLGV
jgi:ArsR family metal-binding transcriptional regulator